MLLCFKCAMPYQPAHELDEYCRVCHVAKKADASRRMRNYEAIKADPARYEEYKTYMRLYMRERRANGQDKTRPHPKKRSA